MNRFHNIYSKIISESFISQSGQGDQIDPSTNKFYNIVDVDLEEFCSDIKQGEGWIADDQVMEMFLDSFPDYNCDLFNFNELETLVRNKLEQTGIPIKSYEDAQKEGLL